LEIGHKIRKKAVNIGYLHANIFIGGFFFVSSGMKA